MRPHPLQLPFQIPQMPSNRYHKAINRATFGGYWWGACIIALAFKNDLLFRILESSKLDVSSELDVHAHLSDEPLDLKGITGFL